MNTQTQEFLSRWSSALDSQIGDTQSEIDKRLEANMAAVNVRNDLKCLIAYLESHEIPDGAYRAINYCLSWNPFAKQ